MDHRIPRTDGDFSSYVNTTADYLEELAGINAMRLGQSPDPAMEWGTRRTAWNLIYGKHKDASKRTKTITAEKDDQKKAFIQFATPILTGLSVNAALTNDDRGVFNLPEREAPTERTKITDTPFGKIISMDGGDIKVRVRTTEDGNRASKHPDADHLEMRYALVDLRTNANTGGANTNPESSFENSVVNSIPTTAMDCVLSTISRKAIFTVALGQENSGKRIYAFFRWVNASKLENSSSWSMVVQGVVV